jgi:hypothetical protein
LPFLLTSCFSSCHIKATWLTEGQSTHLVKKFSLYSLLIYYN